MKIEIFEEDDNNTLSFDDKYADYTIDVYPETKTYQSRMNLKDDVYYRTEQFEYRIKTDPVIVEKRLIERVDEPPKEYKVRDGVVLESEITKNNEFLGKDFIDDLKKEVEWHEDWAGNPVSMYILSKHPEMISSDDYRRHLRQFAEKIKTAIIKLTNFIKNDGFDFQIKSDNGETYIGMYKNDDESVKDFDEYHKLKDEEKNKSTYGKKLIHLKKIKGALFDEKSKEYVGISEGEFRTSEYILENIETFLNKKSTPVKKIEPKISKKKLFFTSLILTFLLSWVVSWFVDINPFLIFIIVQVIAFAQSVVGNWVGKILDK